MGRARPRRGAAGICIEEKAGLRAKPRRYPGGPPRPGGGGGGGGRAGGECECARNGPASIIAALPIATGQVVTEPIEHNDSVTFTGFLHQLDQCTDPRLNIHIVMDNGPSHTARATGAWIAAHPRITLTYTPQPASWLDLAELWFSVLTRALLRRGEFTSRADLADKITSFAIRYNRTAKPWTCAYDAGSDHARHLARHARHHHSVAAGPATASALPTAA